MKAKKINHPAEVFCRPDTGRFFNMDEKKFEAGGQAPQENQNTQENINNQSGAAQQNAQQNAAARKAAAAGAFRKNDFGRPHQQDETEHPSAKPGGAGTAPVRSRTTSRQARTRTRTRPTAAGTATGSPLPSRGSRRRTARTAPSPANIINGTMRIISRPRRRKVSIPARRKIKA